MCCSDAPLNFRPFTVFIPSKIMPYAIGAQIWSDSSHPQPRVSLFSASPKCEYASFLLLSERQAEPTVTVVTSYLSSSYSKDETVNHGLVLVQGSY